MTQNNIDWKDIAIASVLCIGVILIVMGLAEYA